MELLLVLGFLPRPTISYIRVTIKWEYIVNGCKRYYIYCILYYVILPYIDGLGLLKISYGSGLGLAMHGLHIADGRFFMEKGQRSRFFYDQQQPGASGDIQKSSQIHVHREANKGWRSTEILEPGRRAMACE